MTPDINQQYETQIETIHRYQRQDDHHCKRIEKLQSMYDNSQDYIAKLKAHIAALEAKLTDEAIAERFFENGE